MKVDLQTLRKHIGDQLPASRVEVEKELIRRFARVIGLTNPIHFDEAAAKAAGYRSLVAPPTFFTVMEEMSPPSMAPIVHLGFDATSSLHAQQRFEYHEPICAGDEIEISERIVDIFDKKDGELIFIVSECTGTNQAGQVTIKTRATNVVRQDR